MSTLVLQSRSVIANPKYGKLLDLNDGLRILLDARLLSLAQGATVSSWAGLGSGVANETVFDRKITAWEYPTMQTTDKKSVYFNGNAALANNNTATTSLTKTTYIVAAKITDPNATTEKQGRLFTGTTDGGFQGVYPAAGRMVMSGALGNEVDIGVIPTGWFIGIYVFDGAESKVLLSNANDIAQITGIVEGSQTRLMIGGNINITAPEGKGMKGNIALFAQYDKALSSTEMLAAMSYYRNELSI